MKQSEQTDLVQAGLVVWECVRVLAAGTVTQWGIRAVCFVEVLGPDRPFPAWSS